MRDHSRGFSSGASKSRTVSACRSRSRASSTRANARWSLRPIEVRNASSISGQFRTRPRKWWPRGAEVPENQFLTVRSPAPVQRATCLIDAGRSPSVPLSTTDTIAANETSSPS
ncbi:methane monooxygenase/ammonia monooxygenase subunit B [Methylorubrum aminovorans]|uniref:methane monooxygenase/ammonia monooxygenase subunit B n=1 Tax=Methylorubrum aminovorans TaxID=269069 RepID=UPI003570F563